MLKKLVTNTAIYGLAPQIPRIAAIFSLPIITKYLTEVDFGVFGVITAIVASLTSLATLGLNIILANSFYKNPFQYKWAWRQIYGFLILWNIPFSLLLACLLYFFIPQEAHKNTLYIILLNVIPIVFFGPTTLIGNLFYQLKQKPFQIAFRGALFGTITVGLNVYFIAYLKMGYMGWFLAIAISTMLTQISYWYPVNMKLGLTPIFNFKWRFIKNSLKISLPTVPHYYSAYLLDTSDRLVMKWMDVSTSDIGKYNVANTIGNLFQQVGLAAGVAISPMLNQLIKDKDELTARNLVFMFQISLFVLSFISCLWVKEAFYILIKNDQLREVYPLAIIIIMSYNFRPMYIGVSSKLFYHEKTKVLLKVTLIAGVCNLLLNLFLIPFLGYEIAAFTTFGSLMYMGYAGYFLNEYKKLCDLPYYPLIWLTLTLVLTAIAYFSVEFNVITKGFFTVFALSIGYISFKKTKLNFKS